MADTQTTTLPRQAGITLGKSGTFIQDGFITGEEYSRDLQGKQAIRMWDIMRRSDSTVRRTLQICKLPILSSHKDVDPASDDEEDQFRARFIKRELMERNVKFHKFQREALSFFDFGHSVFEITYELTVFEGRTLIGIKSIDSRKQTSIYSWQTQDKKPGITQILQTSDNVSIPRGKLVVFTHDQEGENYEGVSLLRAAYKDWNIKDKLIIINAIAMEKMALGIPVIKKDGTINVSDAEVAKVRAALRNIRANEESYLEIPAGLIVEMLNLQANQTKDVLPTVQYHDRQIVGSVLAQFTELGGTKGSGSNALSQDQSELFLKSEEAADQIIVDAIQEDIIKQLSEINFSDNEERGYATLRGGSISDEDVAQMSEALSKLITANAITLSPEVENKARELVHLPELTDEQVAEYEAKKQQEADLAAAATEAAAAGNPVDPQTDKTVKADPKKPANQKEKDALKASALLEASQTFRRQINVLMLD